MADAVVEAAIIASMRSVIAGKGMHVTVEVVFGTIAD